MVPGVVVGIGRGGEGQRVKKEKELDDEDSAAESHAGCQHMQHVGGCCSWNDREGLGVTRSVEQG